MEKKKVRLSRQEEGQRSAPSPSPDKKPWQDPKLAFVKPKLTKHGELKEVTGFFGQFSP